MISARPYSLIVALLATSACTAPAEDGSTPAASMTAEATAAQLELENLIRVTRTLHEKFRSLAEAMPEDDLAWPEEIDLAGDELGQ